MKKVLTYPWRPIRSCPTPTTASFNRCFREGELCSTWRAGSAAIHTGWRSAAGESPSADISEVALRKARESAGKWADRIDFRQLDLSTFTAGPEAYDVILAFFYLERSIFPELQKALRPGGLLIYKTYTELHPKFGKGPTHPMHLLGQNELLRAFHGLHILRYEETVHARGIAELVGRKIALEST